MFILKPPGLTKEGVAKALLAGENARKLSGERLFAKTQRGHSASVMLYSAKQKSRRTGSGSITLDRIELYTPVPVLGAIREIYSIYRTAFQAIRHANECLLKSGSRLLFICLGTTSERDFSSIERLPLVIFPTRWTYVLERIKMNSFKQ